MSSVLATYVTQRIFLNPATSLSKSLGPLILPTFRKVGFLTRSEFMGPDSTRLPKIESWCRRFRDSSNESGFAGRSPLADGVSAIRHAPPFVQRSCCL